MLLVAPPDLEDPHFARTVVLVTRHRHGAPVGLILNRPTPLTLGQAFPDQPGLAGRTDPVYSGGPVSASTIVILHRSKSPLRGSLRVVDDVYMSVDPEVIREVLGQGPPPEALRVYAGYAGWAPGQLEEEIRRGSWYVLPAEAGALFAGDPATLWADLVRQAPPSHRRPSI